MNLINLLNNEKIQNLFAENMAQALTSFYQTPISPLEYQTLKGTKYFDIKSMGLVRFMSPRSANFIILGTSDANTLKLVSSVEPAKQIELQQALVQALQKSICSLLENTTQSEELKDLFAASADQIGFLKEVDSTHLLRFEFSYEYSKLVFEIPFECSGYKLGLLFKNIGFGDLAKILIVDDSKMNRMILKNYLRAIGFLNIEEAEDGTIALNKIKQSASGFDLIVADWHMPSMNGIDVLKELRTNLETQRNITPFILATSEQKKEEILQAVKYKVSGYLIKPYSADKLFAAMKAAKAATEKN